MIYWVNHDYLDKENLENLIIQDTLTSMSLLRFLLLIFPTLDIYNEVRRNYNQVKTISNEKSRQTEYFFITS